MKKLIIISVLIFCFHSYSFAQDIPPITEEQLENQTDVDQAETEDDSYLQILDQFRRNPINLNTAEASDLKQLRMLSALQIENFISYRRIFGKLLNIYELQAVPTWDVVTIHKILPYVSIFTPVSLTNEAVKRFRFGDHSLLLRVTQVLERSKGFDNATTGTKYLGSPQHILFRYRYSFKGLLQYGIVGDKDAGEQFFKGSQKQGFDFYSFHLFARKIGIIQSLALGDFTINLGQGLIQWQALAFKKSADVMAIKRESPVLLPYNSAGEFYFNRGAGITIAKGRMEATAFVSIRKLSANFVADTVNHEDFISSFLNSGYHRTNSENADRNNLRQTSFGGNVNYKGNNWQVGLNGIYYNFSFPVEKRNEPYNLFAISGKNWYNMSVDYSWTHHNIHFFGEAAVDKNAHTAFVNGLMISVDPRIDLSFVQRRIEASYQAINGDAFTEGTYPTNEYGIYAGITIRPIASLRLDAYSDFYKFPWLKYQVDAPSSGRDFLAQLTYTPSKAVEIYSRYRAETKQGNQSANNTTTNYLVWLPRQNWRIQASYKLTSGISLRNRVELLWYDHKGINKENGFLTYMDFLYKPLQKPWSTVLRLQYFETDGYNSRIYAFENDVLFSYSIPAFFDKGYRYYLIINYDLSKKISFWFRWAQTIYSGQSSVGSGLDEIPGDHKTELKLQLRWML